jgi:hypothetical protein
MDLDILPPDSDVFHKSDKKTSTKQKDHLIKARAKARETIERRRQLDKEAKEKAIAEEKPEEIEEEVEEEVEEEEPKAKPTKKKVAKKVELTEEEQELRRFEKFMKNMNHYEKLKEQKRLDDEEAKKIKVSFTQEEYDELLKILDEKEGKAKQEQELKDAIPTAPKKKEEEYLPESIVHSLRPRPVTRGRFR